MKTYPLFKVHIDKTSALKNIEQVFDSGFINEGSEVTLLTEAMKRQLDVKNLLLVNSCTSALTLSLKLIGVDQNADVVSTPMTCVATNTPIVATGAQIIWADVDLNTGMITPETVQKAITPATKAVIVVAWAGTPPDLKGIKDVCLKHNISLILDAAHAFGACFAGEPIHRFADYTCYSFQAIKHFTTGDGGALICSNDEAYARAKSLKWFGLDRDHVKDAKGDWRGQQWDVDIVESGYKFNMNNVAAAIGLSQIDHIDRTLGLHRKHAKMYDELFYGFEPVQPVVRHVEADSSHWVYTMLVNDKYSRFNRDELLKALNLEQIMAGVVHVPNDDYTAFARFRKNLPGVRSFSQHQLSIPCGWWLTENDVNYIAHRVKELSR